MEVFLHTLDIVGYVSTGIVLIAFFVGLYKWINGISPALWRLGKGLANRKIAIFASGDEYTSLHDLLVDSSLFKSENICKITERECKKAEGYSLFLVHWKSARAHFQEVLDTKKDATAVIVYAPREEGNLPDETIDKLNKHRNAILVNMRGRLLNDIVVSLITTSYEKN